MKAPLFFAIFLMVGQAFALPQHMKSFSTAYPQFKRVSCTVCHIQPPKLNPYGLAVQKTIQAGVVNVKAIESLDSDEDQYTNIEEITAGSMPGDKDSTPSRP